MKIRFKLLFVGICAIALFTQCKKEAIESPQDDPVTVSVEFDNIVGGQNLILNSVNYTNAAGELFSVSMLQYYVSNLQLRKTDGAIFILDQDSSYFLIRENDPQTRFARFKIPAGDYDQISFIIGVDSLRSTMDLSKRTGVLDPSAGHDEAMYWGWNSGYIFFRLEGISASAPLDPSGQRKYRFHIGGFGGYSAPTINNIKRITLDLTTSGILQARKTRTPNIHLMADLLNVFNGTTTLSIANNPTVMLSDYSTAIAANYSTMFYHDHTEN